jgi:hypothetical protein
LTAGGPHPRCSARRSPTSPTCHRPSTSTSAEAFDAGEVTDKGYINRRRVLARRAALVEMLYAAPVPAAVVVAE